MFEFFGVEAGASMDRLPCWTVRRASRLGKYAREGEASLERVDLRFLPFPFPCMGEWRDGILSEKFRVTRLYL